MNKSHTNKLAEMLDTAIWKNPKYSIQKLIKHHNRQDPRKLAHAILREGTALSKDEKKKYGINALAKAFTSIFGHFTEGGISDCVKSTTELAYAVSAIEISLSNIKDWEEWGRSRLEFSPAPDTCPICKKLEGVYNLKDAPIPVLDTHLGCRCCVVVM